MTTNMLLLLDSDGILEMSMIKDLITGYTLNKQLFPMPYEMISYLHNKNIRLGLHINLRRYSSS